MRIKICSFLLAIVVLTACKKDFLERLPLDQLTDDTYWTSENNVRAFAWGFYPAFFTGYGSSYAWGRYFSGQSLNDDFAPSSPAQFTQIVPPSGGGWTFSWVRKANLLIDRVKLVPMDEEAVRHWTGIGRFFRAMEYYDLVKRFGDVPWFGRPLTDADEEELYKPRDPRTLVMDSVLADFQYAAANVRESDGTAGLTVNKFVVLAFMSRVFLYEGTWQKYHFNNTAKATEYLEAAKWAANEVIASGKYQVANDYRGMFNSLSLAGNKEVMLYREYATGQTMHSLNSYVNKEPQTGASKNAIESYLCNDGLPIGLSPLYQGDSNIQEVMADRDPRLYETFVQELRPNGEFANYSTSGYAVHKFLNEDIKDAPEGNGNLNPTDGPVIRYGEVLMNYAEAAAELGTITQIDLDKSINALRDRADVQMKHLQVVGGLPAIDSVTYNDPQRDPTIPSLLWEIRRERRIELMMEGFRLDDLKRWKKLEYTDTQGNPDINRGAWIRVADWPLLKDTKIENDAAEGYIIPAWKPETQRLFTNPRVYLEPLPLDQIKLYQDKGYELTQNTGWE
ncbi:MAG TPA: RagB/SusD family nutrient uptake outer membrane protein [Thermoclostridium sp.]